MGAGEGTQKGSSPARWPSSPPDLTWKGYQWRAGSTNWFVGVREPSGCSPGLPGRSASVVVSGTDIVRPSGQRKGPQDEAPVFGPSTRLDIEAELGFVVGTGHPMGEPLPIERAEDHIFGVVLFNDLDRYRSGLRQTVSRATWANDPEVMRAHASRVCGRELSTVCPIRDFVPSPIASTDPFSRPWSTRTSPVVGLVIRFGLGEIVRDPVPADLGGPEIAHLHTGTRFVTVRGRGRPGEGAFSGRDWFRVPVASRFKAVAQSNCRAGGEGAGG